MVFSLTTNGGSEYCGNVIQVALNELNWSEIPDDLQMIFIAGNEGFDQGSVSHVEACNLARTKNVVVNTIFCGNYQQGIGFHWKDCIGEGNGKYMNIDQDALVVHIPSPFDKEIQKLDSKLNDTYIPYGKKGSSKKKKQIAQDKNASSYGAVNSVKRTMSKGTKIYKNNTWDLVDASDTSRFKLVEVKTEMLPDTMKAMSLAERKVYLNKHKVERNAVKSEIMELKKKREAYVAKVKLENAKESENQLDDAIISSIVKQAEAKSFRFERANN